MTISCLKREKTPKYTEKQAEKAKNFCKKLANLLYRSSCCVILDDEKYLTFDGSNMEENDNYYTNDKPNCPKECLEKRLFPFIREHHPDSNYIFWLDLAGCHYSKQTVAWMDENVPKFVPKDMNPPNVPPSTSN